MAEVTRASVLEMFPQFYDERQTVSAATHVAHVTRFWSPTVRTAFTMSAVRSCGGWSRRGRLYVGSDELDVEAPEPREVIAGNVVSASPAALQ